MACLPQTQLLRLVIAATLVVLPATATAQITEAEINELVDQNRIPDDDPEIAELVRQAEQAQKTAIEEAQNAVSESLSVEQALRDEYGIELRPEPGDPMEDPSLYIFVSFSMPDPLIRDYLQDALRYGGRVVVRGLVDGSMAKTQRKLGFLIEEDENRRIGASVDPRAFEAFDIEVVPAIALGEHAVKRCDTEDCVVQAGAHDIIYGAVSVQYALEEFAARGDVRVKARQHLKSGINYVARR